MDLVEIPFHDAVPVDGYGPGFFRVGGQVHHGNLLLGAPMPPVSWHWDDLADRLAPLIDKIDLLLVGTGAQMVPADPRIDAALGTSSVGLEPMATPTACRSYNLLLAEGRRVAALLLAV